MPGILPGRFDHNLFKRGPHKHVLRILKVQVYISKFAYTRRIWHRHYNVVVAIGDEAGLCRLAIPSCEV